MAVVLNIRWNGGEFKVEVEETDTMTEVKIKMKEETKVEPAKQKYIGLKTVAGKMPNDATLVSELVLKPKIMMMGYGMPLTRMSRIGMLRTPDSVIDQTMKHAETEHEVKDDFDIDPNDEISIDVRDRPEGASTCWFV